MNVTPASPSSQPVPVPVGLNPPQWFQGYLTHAALVVSLLGLLCARLGLHASPEQITGVITWLAANWDVLVSAGGIVVAMYGRLRREWRVEMGTVLGSSFLVPRWSEATRREGLRIVGDRLAKSQEPGTKNSGGVT